MKIQLTRVTRSRKGHPIRAQSIIEADAPMIGRGAQCAIHLSDPRVAFEHASVFVSDGARRITGVGGAMLMVDGHAAGDIVLAPGSHFDIGPYTFTVENPPPGVDLAIAVELVRPLPDSLAEIVAKSRFSLDAGGISKRSMAWTGLFVVLVLFLLVPVINPTLPVRTPPPADGQDAAKDAGRGTTAQRSRAIERSKAMQRGISADVVWNPGELAGVHQRDSYNCNACHEQPFVRVRDHACLQCHEKMPGHLRDARLQAALFGNTRCAECHQDHRGGDTPIRADSGLCARCHADIQRAFAQTKLGNVADFGTAHPEFRLTIWRGPGPEDVLRIKQSDKAQLFEIPHLRFSHAKHLKPGLKGPEGRENLKCESCHAPEASKKGFLAIQMNRDCLRCHELRIEPDDPSRQVAHGSVEDAWLMIKDFYAKISLEDIRVDTVRTGEVERSIPMASDAIVPEQERQRRQKFARVKAQKVAVDLFEVRVCKECHSELRRSTTELPAMETALPWIVPPVHIANAWMPKAVFDHSKHRNHAKCTDCHDIERSQYSTDVSLPDIATCRASGCHGGFPPVPGMVASTCIDCHDYHLAEPRAAPARTATTTPGMKQ